MHRSAEKRPSSLGMADSKTGSYDSIDAHTASFKFQLLLLLQVQDFEIPFGIGCLRIAASPAAQCAQNRF